MGKDATVKKYLTTFFYNGSYSTLTKYYDTMGGVKAGVMNIIDVTEVAGNNVGKKIIGFGNQNHVDVTLYDYDSCVSVHASVMTNASHGSKIVKATNTMLVKEGHGYSHRRKKNVDFKKVFKKNKDNNNLNIRLYLKDATNDKYNLHSKTTCTFVEAPQPTM